MQPVGGGIDQETRGDAQTTEREMVAVTVVVAEMMMILAAVVVAVLVLVPFLLLEEVDMDLVVVRVDGSQIPR